MQHTVRDKVIDIVIVQEQIHNVPNGEREEEHGSANQNSHQYYKYLLRFVSARPRRLALLNPVHRHHRKRAVLKHGQPEAKEDICDYFAVIADSTFDVRYAFEEGGDP
eukprot:CAMPEP_0172505512 /NCGR_PEP_ID=MMETSP1066-20121228/187062_1 /TAXON_ID=671091 /ORGANISM="Coscinodiscus wailesii, Strain CCMP2513" /LENGTH=107 /DNA_ID=CAMNT_0013282143 /DNA_START=573 /DNA_END=899 /DNA_ORIENTATION=+